MLTRFENWNISVSQGKDKLAWVWRMEDVECGFGTVVSSIRLPFSFLHFSSTSSDSHSLARTTLHRSCTLIVPSRVANSIYQSTIFGFHHFSSSLKKFNFLNLLSRVYIYIVVPISAIRKSDFLKNHFKVVKFLNTRKVFHLFVALPPIPTIGW